MILALTLKNIATVSSGATFRSQIKPSENGSMRVIQMKDLGDDNFVHLKESTRIDHSGPRPEQLAKLGDIIFRSRGQRHTAALLRENAKNTIVAAPLLRVRPDTERVIPEFLLWWINRRSTQSYLSTRSMGTMVQMVSKQNLEDLEVNLPSLEQQRKIIDIFNLSMREQQLLEEIKHRKAIYADGMLMQMVSGSHPILRHETSDIDATTSMSGSESVRRNS